MLSVALRDCLKSYRLTFLIQGQRLIVYNELSYRPYLKKYSKIVLRLAIRHQNLFNCNIYWMKWRFCFQLLPIRRHLRLFRLVMYKVKGESLLVLVCYITLQNMNMLNKVLVIIICSTILSSLDAQIGAKLIQYPDVSEDKICFTFGDDLWLVSKEGGDA